MTSTHQRAAHMLAAAADLLDQGQFVNRLSVAVTAIGVAVLLLPIFPASAMMAPAGGLVALVGLVELFLALRVGLDAALFRRLANDAAADRLDVVAFDAALIALKLMKAGKEGRPIVARFAGARLLLILQGVALLLQVIIAIGAGTAMFLELV